MFKEIFIGPCFIQVGVCPGLSLFMTEGIYSHLFGLQQVRTDDTIALQLIIGPLMVGVGVIDVN